MTNDEILQWQKDQTDGQILVSTEIENLNIKIEGTAFSDQDIVNFVAALNKQKTIASATLSSVNVAGQQGLSAAPSKAFVILGQVRPL